MKFRLKQKIYRIVARASTISGCLSFILGFFGLSLSIALPIGVALNLLALIISFIVQYAPETLDDIIKHLKNDDVHIETHSEALQKLYIARSELESFINAKTESLRDPTVYSFTTVNPIAQNYPQ